MRRALAMVAALALGLGLLLSPVADWAVRVGASLGAPGTKSIRELGYDISPPRLRGTEAYPAVLAAKPAYVTSLYVMGSSEFGTDVDSNGRRFFPNRVNDFDMFVSGRGYEQSLFHAIELGAVSRQLQPKKAVFILSPQWFTPTGVKPGQFDMVFSASYWRAMLANPDLAPTTRARLVARAGQVAPGLCNALDRCPGGSLVTKARSVVETPYALLDQDVSLLKETYQAVQVNRQYSAPYAVAPGSVPVDSIDWNAERAKAAAVGATMATNRFGFADSWYDSHKDQLQKLKGAQASTTMGTSPEYDDLQLFLDVAKDTGVQVMLVLPPMNGPWVDWLGLSKAQRAVYYDKIRAMAATNGARLADFSAKEYESYYFWDAIHVGWKGWVDVDEACVRFARS